MRDGQLDAVTVGGFGSVVLCAVFVPTAFMAGISGQFYRQFALAIAIAHRYLFVSTCSTKISR